MTTHEATVETVAVEQAIPDDGDAFDSYPDVLIDKGES